MGGVTPLPQGGVDPGEEIRWETMGLAEVGSYQDLGEVSDITGVKAQDLSCLPGARDQGMRPTDAFPDLEGLGLAHEERERLKQLGRDMRGRHRGQPELMRLWGAKVSTSQAVPQGKRLIRSQSADHGTPLPSLCVI